MDIREGQYYVDRNGELLYINAVDDNTVEVKVYLDGQDKLITWTKKNAIEVLEFREAELYELKEGDIWEDNDKNRIKIVETFDELVDWENSDDEMFQNGKEYIYNFILENGFRLMKGGASKSNYDFKKGDIYVNFNGYICYIENVDVQVATNQSYITYINANLFENNSERVTKDLLTLQAIAYNEQWKKYLPKVGDVWLNLTDEKYVILDVENDFVTVEYTNLKGEVKKANYSNSQFFGLILPLELGHLQMEDKVEGNGEDKSGGSMYETMIEKSKKELAQLLMLRSFLSPIDFEKKLEINQRIDIVQKEINDYNFKLIEYNLSKDDLIDDLFEQSFTPINNLYTDVYAKTSKDESQKVTSNFFTPDGSPSKLSDSLNMLIRTPEFIEWFGNWQLSYAYRDEEAFDVPCSKVISKEYEPLVVWHGTGAEFSYFRFDNFPAAYFAVNWKYSKWFADMQGGGNGFIIPFFLNIRNPLDLTQFETRPIKSKQFFDYVYLKTGMTMDDLEVNPIFYDANTPPLETWVYLRNNPKMLKKIADLKIFDGIHFYETNPSVPKGEAAHSTEVFITFEPSQAKIADPERGNMLFASMKSFLLKKGGEI